MSEGFYIFKISELQVKFLSGKGNMRVVVQIVNSILSFITTMFLLLFLFLFFLSFGDNERSGVLVDVVTIGFFVLSIVISGYSSFKLYKFKLTLKHQSLLLFAQLLILLVFVQLIDVVNYVL